MVSVYIDASWITDRASFHAVFKEVFGFPDFYGANMEHGLIAWIILMIRLQK